MFPFSAASPGSLHRVCFRTLDRLRASCAVTPAVLVLLTACGAGSDVRRDGEVALPENYASWTVVRQGIQRTDKNEVHDIFVNDVGATRVEGAPFPHGSQFVMTLHEARPNADGRLERGALTKLFVMTKGDRWGDHVEGLGNGDWVYSAFGADGKTPTGDSFQSCRACHAPHETNDFVIPSVSSP